MEQLLEEKYRPQKWEQVVAQDKIVELIKAKGKNIQHMLFLGQSGVGKTTLAHVIALENDIPIEELNASDERGIDIVRGKIKQLSTFRGARILLLDEADSLTTDAQNALRRIIEKAKNTRFILCGNYSHKFIDAIKSRCSIHNFRPIGRRIILDVLLRICGAEEIELDMENEEIKRGFVELVDSTRGDLRKAINILDKLTSEDKVISVENITTFKKSLIAKDVLETALGGDFKKARNLIENAFIDGGADPNQLVYDLYEAIGDIKELKHQVKLYLKLKDIATACKYGNDPIIQLVGFVAYVYLIPHLNSECPVLKGEYEK